MAVRMTVKLSEEQKMKLLAPVSVQEIRETGIQYYSEYIRYKENKMVEEIAKESEYHPADYGMWGTSILRKDDEFYAIWNRGNSCD